MSHCTCADCAIPTYGRGHICIFVTVAGKTDHFVKISDFEIMVPRCSVHFALHICAVQFVIDGHWQKELSIEVSRSNIYP